MSLQELYTEGVDLVCKLKIFIHATHTHTYTHCTTYTARYKEFQEMAKIQIYARLRPTTNPFDGLSLQTSSTKDTTNSNVSTNTITVDTENKDESWLRYSKSPGSKLHFKFNHIFNMQATQDEVFDIVARQ